MNTYLQPKKAFTLIELLIVITIIGILAVALIPRLTGGPARARDAQRKADLQQIATALEFSAQDNGGLYPATPSGSCVSSLSLSNYLTTSPSDPSNPTAAMATGFCATGYTYKAMNSRAGYMLVSELETNSDTGASGIYLKSSVTGYTTWNSTSASSAFTSFTACTSSAPCTDAVYALGR